MRTLSETIEAAKNASQKCFLLLCEIETATGTLYYANCLDDIQFPADSDGQVYVSKSFVLDEATMDSGFSFPEKVVSVANLDQALSYASLTRSLRGRAARVKQIFIDTATGLALGDEDDYIDLVDGLVEEVEAMEVAVKITCLPKLAKIDREAPVTTYAPACPWVFGDSACTFTPGEETAQTCDAGTTAKVIADAARSEADNYWKNGYVEMTSGDYDGDRRRILSNTSGSVTLEFPFPGAPATGNTYTIRQGCDKTYDTCESRFSNESNFGGCINYDEGIVK